MRGGASTPLHTPHSRVALSHGWPIEGATSLWNHGVILSAQTAEGRNVDRKRNPNPLGDLRAEADLRMLNVAFIETPDFQTIIGGSERSIVVGRRGTGKSALTYHLSKHWKSQPDTVVVLVTPEEDQILGLRALVSAFGDKFSHVRAGCRIAWRYALLLEIATALSSHHRFVKATDGTLLPDHVRRWRQLHGGSVSARLRSLMRSFPHDESPEERIGNLAQLFRVDDIQDGVKNALDATRTKAVVLIDKLDEGYETDTVGVGIIDGLVQATIDINTRLRMAQATTFIRDNMFRAVSQLDADFSRNIEGQVLRLHWDEYQLMNFVATRLKVAFGVDQESDLKVWNRCVAGDLKGREGFRRCLQLTLYRPRDVIALLNEAFYRAFRQDREEIVGSDLDDTAREISRHRLDDLHKEYSVIFPGLDKFTTAFAHETPENSMAEVYATLDTVGNRDEYPPKIQQQFRLLGESEEIARALYSVGFLGVKEDTSGTYVFCHDGKAPTRDFVQGDRMLVHPCYWMALSLHATLEPGQAEDIHDEYDIEVTSATPKLRQAQLGKLMGQFGQIPVGEVGSGAFEEWCVVVIRVLWAGHLRNVELHPNKNATQRRDVVASNLSEKGVFRRILNDYGSRQVIFEVKNYQHMGPEENRQMISYLGKEYGRLGFIITRDDEIELRAGSELDWVRELYSRNPPLLVIRLTGRWLVRLLSKLRNPVKHNEPDLQLNKLIDVYERLYTAGQGARAAKKDRRRTPRN
jgi:hypothetical protein